jgi:hypothetical protein
MSHVINDKISLELAQAIAAELPHRPEWIELARSNLKRGMELNKNSPSSLRNYREWMEILDKPIMEIIAILTGLTDESQRLRSNTPFAGTLTPQQVWEIKRRVRHDERAA